MKGELTLCEFLLARMAEEEQDATDAAAARGPHWEVEEAPAFVWGDDDHDTEILAKGKPVLSCSAEYGGVLIAGHVARHDPATVLADVAARRRIVEPHVGVHRCDWGDYTGGDCGECTTEVLRLLTVRYAGHPDHYSGWAPEEVRPHG